MAHKNFAIIIVTLLCHILSCGAGAEKTAGESTEEGTYSEKYFFPLALAPNETERLRTERFLQREGTRRRQLLGRRRTLSNLDTMVTRRRALHLRGGLGVGSRTASGGIGKMNFVDLTCGGDAQKKGLYSQYFSSTCRSPYTHDSKSQRFTPSFRASDNEYLRFYTCSYHWGAEQLRWVLAGSPTIGSSMSRKLTFRITYFVSSTTGRDVLYDECSSAADCADRFPPWCGIGNAPRSCGRGLNHNSPPPQCRMGPPLNPTNQGSNIWASYLNQRSAKKRDFGTYETVTCSMKSGSSCNTWHESDFRYAKGFRHDKAGASNGPSTYQDVWSTQLDSAGASQGLDLRRLISAIKSYGWGDGTGLYRARIGGFGCEVDEDTTFFHIEKSNCEPASYCPGGSESDGSCSRDCQQCPAGWYQPQESAASCSACPAGRYGPASAGPTTRTTLASSCVNCPEGFASSANGQSTCTQCANGRFSFPAGQPCQDCAGGRISASPVRSGCTSCAAGKYSDDSLACKRCGVNPDGTTPRANPHAVFCKFEAEGPTQVTTGYYARLKTRPTTMRSSHARQDPTAQVQTRAA